MKKAYLFLILLFFAFPAFAQLSDAYSTVETKVTKLVNPGKDTCPVYADTPMSKVNRPSFEVDFRIGLLDSPQGGSFAFRTDNFDLVLRHNLSSTLFAYGWYGTRNYEKPDYEWAGYGEKWTSRMVFGGIGVYLTPVISIYAAGGKVWLENENGDSPDLSMAIERGVSLDTPIGNNKVVISYRIVEAPLSTEDEIDADEVMGDGSFSVLSVSFSVPLDWK